MVMMYLLFLLSLVVCRFFAGYDSRFQHGKYIVIRHRRLRKLLVDEMSFFENKKRPKADINKMTLTGFVFYLYSLVTLVLSVLLHFAVPKIPVEPWEIESDVFFMYADTLNEKLAASCIWFFFLSVILNLAVLMVRYTKAVKQKWIRMVTHIASFVLVAAVAYMLFETVRELIGCFALM